jgi:6-phosphogluconate dehydrogenase
MVGLGRMGGGMTARLQRAGHDVRTFDPLVESTAGSLEELRDQLEAPRIFWLMVPAGEITEAAFRELLGLADAGDTIVDGGNANWRDSQRRHFEASERGVRFLDVGVSGGVWGLREGYCLMAGGQADAVADVEPVFASLAPEGGFAHVGGPGAGHFVKMVHNGIEYALMQSYAEGFEILKGSGLGLDLAQIAGLWRHGSVVRSWLLDLLHAALESQGSDLAGIRGYVEDSGEGRWTLAAAVDEDVPAPALAAALFARFASRQDESFAAKVNAALRHQFGGHAVRPADEPAAPEEPAP